jgi:hypothetical protein
MMLRISRARALEILGEARVGHRWQPFPWRAGCYVAVDILKRESSQAPENLVIVARCLSHARDSPMRHSKPIKTAVLFVFATGPASAQNEPPLIHLTKQALSPSLTYKKDTPRPLRTERNLEGWLVLNGARFRNSEYPQLAKNLAENHAQRGHTSRDRDFTQLPLVPSEPDSHGEIMRGFAICPSRALCGDTVGDITAFDLSSSL